MKYALFLITLIGVFASAWAGPSDDIRAEVELLIVRKLASDTIAILESQGFRPDQIAEVLKGKGFAHFSQAVLEHPNTSAAIDQYVKKILSPEYQAEVARRIERDAAARQAAFLLALQEKMMERKLLRPEIQASNESSSDRLWRRLRTYLLE